MLKHIRIAWLRFRLWVHELSLNSLAAVPKMPNDMRRETMMMHGKHMSEIEEELKKLTAE